MQKIYHILKKYIHHSYFWTLDYIYILYWQLRSVINRKDLAAFYKKNSVTQAVEVILIPGVYESWYVMYPIISFLATNGYNVHVVKTIGYNRGTIESMAENIKEYIDEKNLQNVAIVAHSKGGLIGKYLIMQDASVRNIKGMVAISSPFSGSIYANFSPFRSVRIFRPASSVIAALSADFLSNQRIVSIYGEFDPHIPGGSYLDGAHNIKVPTSGHFRIINDKEVHGQLLRYLVDFSSANS